MPFVSHPPPAGSRSHPDADSEGDLFDQSFHSMAASHRYDEEIRLVAHLVSRCSATARDNVDVNRVHAYSDRGLSLADSEPDDEVVDCPNPSGPDCFYIASCNVFGK